MPNKAPTSDFCLLLRRWGGCVLLHWLWFHVLILTATPAWVFIKAKQIAMQQAVRRLSLWAAVHSLLALCSSTFVCF